MGDAGREEIPRREIFGVVAGVAAGALLALGLYLAARVLQGDSGMLLLSVLLIPPAACALAVAVAGLRRNSRGSASIISALVVTALLVGSSLIFNEGAICLAMAAPLFYPLGLLGGFLTKYLRGGGPAGRLSVAMFVLAPALLLPFEQQEAYPTFEAAIVSEIEIEAPLDRVWANAIEVPDIRPDEQIWTVTQNLLRVPRPMDARLVQRDGALVRDATWQGDIRFSEVITDWQVGRTVGWRFDIPERAADQLLDEHLRLDAGYLQLRSGRYTFVALSPTRTRVTLTTSYAARTPLNAYAKAWGALLLGDIHRNVLHVVRTRSESDWEN